MHVFTEVAIEAGEAFLDSRQKQQNNDNQQNKDTRTLTWQRLDQARPLNKITVPDETYHDINHTDGAAHGVEKSNAEYDHGETDPAKAVEQTCTHMTAMSVSRVRK